MRQHTDLDLIPAVLAIQIAGRVAGGGTGATGALGPRRPKRAHRRGVPAGRVQGDGSATPSSGTTGRTGVRARH